MKKGYFCRQRHGSCPLRFNRNSFNRKGRKDDVSHKGTKDTKELTAVETPLCTLCLCAGKNWKKNDQCHLGRNLLPSLLNVSTDCAAVRLLPSHGLTPQAALWYNKLPLESPLPSFRCAPFRLLLTKTVVDKSRNETKWNDGKGRIFRRSLNPEVFYTGV